jgi:hypothetical protein
MITQVFGAWFFGVFCGWLFFVWYNYRDRSKPTESDDDEIFW